MAVEAEEITAQQSDSAPEQAAPDGGEVSDRSAGEERRGPGWFNRAMERFRSGSAAPEEPSIGADAVSPPQDGEPRTAGRVATVARPEPTRESGSAQAPTEPAQPQPPPGRYVTDEELARLVQSQKDREIAAWHRQRKAEEDAEKIRKLRDEDPWGFAQAHKQAEEKAKDDQVLAQQRLAEQDGWVRNTARLAAQSYDEALLAPVVGLLTDDERRRIAPTGAVEGIQGRKQLLEAGLGALRERWRAEGAKEAEQRLRRDPVFRKRLYGQFSGQLPEPDVVPGGPTQGGYRSENEEMNARLREAFGVPSR